MQATTTSLAMRLALAGVAPAISKHEERPVLNCLSIEPGPSGLRLAAADNYRLAFQDVAAEAPGWEPVLVRRQHLRLLRMVLGGRRDRQALTLTVEGNQLRASTSSLSVSVPLWPGTFPSYQLVVPASEPVATVGLDPKLLGELLVAAAAAGETMVWLELRGKLAPVLVSPVNGGTWRIAVMPVRVP